MKKRVLIVEDDLNLSAIVRENLLFEGFEVDAVSDGAIAVSRARAFMPDLIVLDIMLPDIDGLQVLQRLRADGNQTPILFLTAKDSVDDRIAGLTVGGDDYVTKPFSLDEIVARINAILRRTKQVESEDSILEVGEIKINQDAHEVFANGQLVDLSPTEYKLLRFLMSNPNRVLTKSQILDHVWEYDFNGEMGIVESYVSYLRKKLDPITSEPLIQTKRGVGYMYKSAKSAK